MKDLTPDEIKLLSSMSESLNEEINNEIEKQSIQKAKWEQEICDSEIFHDNMKEEQVEITLRDILKSDDFRVNLAASMVEPIRTSLKYQSIARKIFMPDSLEEEEKDKDKENHGLGNTHLDDILGEGNE